MIMIVKRHLWSFARMVLPTVGFALTCLGAILVSLDNQDGQDLWVIPAYIVIALGIFIMLIAAFWTICNTMKSEVYQRGRHHQHIQVFTVERPSSFPPSYEESQVSQGHADSSPASTVAVDLAPCLAPPLYCQDGSEVPDCTWSWERPPCYSQVEREVQRTAAAEEQSDATSAH